MNWERGSKADEYCTGSRDREKYMNRRERRAQERGETPAVRGGKGSNGKHCHEPLVAAVITRCERDVFLQARATRVPPSCGRGRARDATTRGVRMHRRQTMREPR